MISVITPWLDHPELIPDYEAAVQGAEVVVVDNASQPDNAILIAAMVERLGGRYLRNERNEWFAGANNQGLQASTCGVVMFANNDIAAPAGWLEQVERDVDRADLLAGPSALTKTLDGRALVYLEGWCIAGRRETWEKLGGWDARAYPFPYYEDVDLCFRACRMGMTLRRLPWPVQHKHATTSSSTPGAFDGSDANRRTFEARARAAWASL